MFDVAELFTLHADNPTPELIIAEFAMLKRCVTCLSLPELSFVVLGRPNVDRGVMLFSIVQRIYSSCLVFTSSLGVPASSSRYALLQGVLVPGKPRNKPETRETRYEMMDMPKKKMKERNFFAGRIVPEP